MPSEAAGTTKVGYEPANALGELNRTRPKLGKRCTECVPLARAVRLYLNMIDLYAKGKGIQDDLAKIAAGAAEEVLKRSPR